MRNKLIGVGAFLLVVIAVICVIRLTSDKNEASAQKVPVARPSCSCPTTTTTVLPTSSVVVPTTLPPPTTAPPPPPAPTTVPQPIPANAAEVRPFDPSHPVYQPVPSNPLLHQYSSQIVTHIAANEASFYFATSADSAPIYVGKPTDPVWTLNQTCGGRPVTMHAPLNIQAGSGSDYPLVILDQANSMFTTSGTQPTEFRMWQATINVANRTINANGFGSGSYRNDGALLTNQTLQSSSFVRRALGQAEACGQNTGSGNSYTVGMIRPIDVQRGKIDHAIRIAAGYLRLGSQHFMWPALRTEGDTNSPFMLDSTSGVPMGARIFLDKSVDIETVANTAASKLSDPKNKAFARMFVRALQEYGMIPLDGTAGNNTVGFEGEATADWVNLIGPKNAYGTYNDIARAIATSLPWNSLRVADASVFNSYGR